MICFLNFTSIDFMGGCEKYLLETANMVNFHEDTVLLDVSSGISSLYGRIVLGRKYKDYSKKNSVPTHVKRITISFKHFIPLTESWWEVKKLIKESRRIYARFELPEILICLYWGNFEVFKKIIAAIILVPKYECPENLFSKLHNLVYASKIYKYLLNQCLFVHVLNPRDKDMFISWGIQKVTYLPLAVTSLKLPVDAKKHKGLHVMYVGELSFRKGGDILKKIALKLPNGVSLSIVGDGPMSNALSELVDRVKGITFHGYVSADKLESLYSDADVFLFPSKAESFGLSMIEAAMHGAFILCSEEVSLRLPSYIERNIKNRSSDTYVEQLEALARSKESGKLDSEKIISFVDAHFGKERFNILFRKNFIGSDV